MAKPSKATCKHNGATKSAEILIFLGLCSMCICPTPTSFSIQKKNENCAYKNQSKA